MLILSIALLLCVLAALRLTLLYRRAAGRLRASERLWRNALDALGAGDYSGAIALAAMGEPGDGDGEQVLAQHLRRTVLALQSDRDLQQASRRDLEDVFSSLQDAVLVVDGDTRLRYLNASALQFFELRVEEVLGARLLEALPTFGLESPVRAALQDGRNTAREVSLYAPRARDVFLRVTPVRSISSSVTGAVAILQDLTEMRRLERVRRDFVANASHELRTPVANIRASAETMIDSPDDPELARRFVPRLVEEAERLSRLVSDMLDLARAEAATETLQQRVFLLGVANGVAERLREKAQLQNIEVHCEGDAEAAVYGDAAGLEQVIFNLLDNSLMYTPAGGRVAIEIAKIPASAAAGSAPAPGELAQSPTLAVLAPGSAIEDPAEESQPRWLATLAVSDSGIGIPATDVPHIFERFYRVDKARSRAQGGTGLGLAIVRHIVENHGGHVTVESEIGQGTSFTVALPAA